MRLWSRCSSMCWVFSPDPGHKDLLNETQGSLLKPVQPSIFAVERKQEIGRGHTTMFPRIRSYLHLSRRHPVSPVGTGTCQVGPRCRHGESALVLGLMGRNGMVLMSERHCAVVACGRSMVFLLQQLRMYWHSCRPTRIISSQMHLSLPMITADSEHL